MAMLKSFLLLFIIFSMGNAQVKLVLKCPPGWTNFGVRCFKYFSQLSNWISAERKCQSYDANLVSVHNKLENEFLRSLAPPSTTFWAGAHDGEQDGQWMWSDGTAFDYKGWCSGEPNKYDLERNPENCLELNHSANHCWNDAVCKELRNYVCAKNL